MSREKLRLNYLMILDLFLFHASVFLAYLIRFDFKYERIPPYLEQNIIKIMIVISIVKFVCFLIFKLYSSLLRYAGVHEMINILSATFVASVIVISASFILKVQVPKSVFIISFLVDILMLGGSRFLYRIFRRALKGEISKFKNYKRILLVGGGEASVIVIRELLNQRILTNVPVGIVDDDERKRGRKINGVTIVGCVKEIVQVVDMLKIDEIIIAIPSASNKEIKTIYNECAKTECKVKILPFFSQIIDESVIVQKIRDVAIEDLLGRGSVNLDIDEISFYLKDKVVLITGGGGSIGSELARNIANFAPKELIILDNYENSVYDIQNEISQFYPKIKLNIVIANIRDKSKVNKVFEKYKPSVVFHAAAHKHVPLMEHNPDEAVKNNIFGTLNLAEISDIHDVERFVLISTDKAVNPTNIMGATKRVAEMIIQGINKCSKTEYVAVRFGNVLGSNGSVIPLFKKQISQGGPVKVTHPDITRFFMTINEATRLVIQAGIMAKGGEIFVLDMGEPVKINELARNLIKLSGLEPDEDIKIEYIGLRPGEKLFEEILMKEEGLVKTKNNKIYIASPMFTDYTLLKNGLEKLHQVMLEEPEKITEYLNLMVPTYKKSF